MAGIPLAGVAIRNGLEPPRGSRKMERTILKYGQSCAQSTVAPGIISTGFHGSVLWCVTLASKSIHQACRGHVCSEQIPDFHEFCETELLHKKTKAFQTVVDTRVSQHLVNGAHCFYIILYIIYNTVTWGLLPVN